MIFNWVEELNKVHDCIAKLFVPNNIFFSLSDVIEDEYWTDYLFLHPEVVRIVSTIDQNNQMTNFELTIKK
ncbi:hypothetical protein CRU99_05005 [Malaciobacter mytili]|uniref:hypothetical protein n=1 Tax=Malaciobacter mytili TaxID=603050 RepID=UPI00100BE97D|nr:hypothetical protein [Malaciobacter mytili]RXI44506.1 hypothetical protein CRU99_05005 [Malaciobacter mytili]